VFCQKFLINYICMCSTGINIIYSEKENRRSKIYKITRKSKGRYTGCPVSFCQALLCEKRTKLSRKVLYHFAIFAMINEILIIKIAKYWFSIIFYSNTTNFTKKTARDKKCLFSSHKVLRIVSEFFQIF